MRGVFFPKKRGRVAGWMDVYGGDGVYGVGVFGGVGEG